MKAAAKVLGMVAAALLLYVFAIGPAQAWHAWSVENYIRNPQDRHGRPKAVPQYTTIMTIWAPVYWAVDGSPAAQGVFEWYEDFWTRLGQEAARR